MASFTPRHLNAAVARLTGVHKPHGTHVNIYRIAVVSKDGEPCGVPISVPKDKVYNSNVRAIADVLRMELEELVEWRVLEKWGPDETLEYLSQFTYEILTSPARERRFRTVQRVRPPTRLS